MNEEQDPSSTYSAPSITHNLCDKADAAVHPQTQSPLFSKLPPEIRSVIWTYCVLEYDDPKHPYPVNTHYCRPPDYTHYRIIDTAILLTCRAIHLESRDFPVSENTNVLYQSPWMRVPGFYRRPSTGVIRRRCTQPPKSRPSSTMRHAPPLLIRRMHVFAEQNRLENWTTIVEEHIPRYGNLEHLRITMRKGDWRDSELNAPLVFDPRLDPERRLADVYKIWQRAAQGETIPIPWIPWGGMISDLKHLKVFDLELETSKERESELRDLVAQAQKWKFPLRDTDYSLVAGNQQPQWKYWKGPSCLHLPTSRGEPGPELVVAKLRYLAVQEASVPTSTLAELRL